MSKSDERRKSFQKDVQDERLLTTTTLPPDGTKERRIVRLFLVHSSTDVGRREKKEIPLKGRRVRTRRTRSLEDAFGEGTRAPRKARTDARRRGSEKRARNDDDYAAGKKGKKNTRGDLGAFSKRRERKRRETQPKREEEEEKGEKERRTHGVQRDRRDAKRRAMADVAK